MIDESILTPAPSHVIGPTWRKRKDGNRYLPEKSLGWGILNWLAEYVIQPSGPNAGQAFMPTLEQARFLLWWYAVDERGRFVYRKGVLRRMKGWGKDPLAAAMSLVELCGPVAFSHFDDFGDPIGTTRSAAWIQVAAVSQDQPLALKTQVPVEGGYTTVEKLTVGDRVFDEYGILQTVSRETPVTVQESYELVFDDGTSVTASANHGWTVDQCNGHGDRMIKATRSTKELFESQHRRVRIPLAPRITQDVPLPVSPYLLGVWLGDGNARNGGISVGYSDCDGLRGNIQNELNAGWHVEESQASGCKQLYVKVDSRREYSFRSILRDIDVLGNKNVPDAYLYAGTEQRRALLQGLLDSDGCATDQGNILFTNTNRSLVDAVAELARSLGHKPFVKVHGTSGWVVSWTPADGAPLFRLARKASKQRLGKFPYRYVRSIRCVGAKYVKCIGIDTPSHLFQVETGVLTHNTRNTFSLFPAMASRKLKEEFGIELNKTIIFASNGGMIEAVTASPLAMEGKRPTFVIKNETQWWLENNCGHEMANVIQGNVDKAAYGNCRALSICNAHRPGEESDAEQDWDAYQEVLAGNAVDTGLLYDALEAPADTPVSELADLIEDQEAYDAALDLLRHGIEVAKGDAYWLHTETLIQSILDVRNIVTESRRKILNQINAAEDSWIAPREWDSVQNGSLGLRPGDRVTLGFDGSKGNDWTALVACRIDDAALFLVKHWNPEKWDGQVPTLLVNDTVEWAFATYDVVGMRADVKEFESYVDQWAVKFGKKLEIKASHKHVVAFDMRSNVKDFTLDAERFEAAVLDKEISHDGNPVLRQHVLNAHRRPNNHGISIGKATKDSSRKIDAAVCAVLAFGLRQEFLMSKKNRGRGVVVLR